MRYSHLFPKTLRAAPHDVSAQSYRFLLRAGYIRTLGNGLFALLPLGIRVMSRLEQIVRDEMDALGGQEISVPLVNPIEPWNHTGRTRMINRDLGRFRDRTGREYVLAPTHEEPVVELVRSGLTSYRQLPVFLYQIQTKFRDEARPKHGLIRAREFVMADGYSFHRSFADLNNFFPKVLAAYRRIFNRCSLEDVIVAEAGVGYMGGEKSYEFLLPLELGDDCVVNCSGCGYTANCEVALGSAELDREMPQELKNVATPGCRSMESLSGFLNLPKRKLAKPMVYVTPRRTVMAVVRGDHEVSLEKLSRFLREPVLRLADRQELAFHGLIPGYFSPIGRTGSDQGEKQVTVVVDEVVADSPNMVYGSNDAGRHLLNVNFGRDYETGMIADISRVTEHHLCRHCGKPLNRRKALELANIFRLGEFYSRRMNLWFTGDRGDRVYPQMGSYGIGMGRLLASIVERHCDRDGIVWPRDLAPFRVFLMSIGKSPAVTKRVEKLYQPLDEDVLYDDRVESVSKKFKDADLLGIPYRIIVSQDTLTTGRVEVRDRKTGEIMKVSQDDVPTIAAGADPRSCVGREDSTLTAEFEKGAS